MSRQTFSLTRTSVSALAVCVALAGCVVGPDYRSPTPLPSPALRPSETQVAQTTASPLPSRWWRLFDDADLDRLVERALSRNTDLRQAAANLQRSRAALSEARAGRLP